MKNLSGYTVKAEVFVQSLNPWGRKRKTRAGVTSTTCGQERNGYEKRNATIAQKMPERKPGGRMLMTISSLSLSALEPR